MSRVLITNDDGIAAPGLRWLAEAAVTEGHDVVVAAPLEEASGASAAMSAYTSDGRVIIERHTLDGLDVPAYAVAASPSYIVVLAMLETFGALPELVLSGINRGANAGRAVLHSGTVGAAFTAAAHSCPAMAVSLDVLSPMTATSGGNALAILDDAADEQRNWPAAAELARGLLKTLAETTDGTVLNLNVPDLPAEEVRGLRRAGLARFGQVQMALAEQGEDFVRTAMEQSREAAEPGTDLAWLNDGYATLTAIRAVSEAAFAGPED
ncbi:MAG: 5'/3'-nucleotidase SurE [Micromonosporaceae bacterium]